MTTKKSSLESLLGSGLGNILKEAYGSQLGNLQQAALNQAGLANQLGQGRPKPPGDGDSYRFSLGEWAVYVGYCIQTKKWHFGCSNDAGDSFGFSVDKHDASVSHRYPERGLTTIAKEKIMEFEDKGKVEKPPPAGDGLVIHGWKLRSNYDPTADGWKFRLDKGTSHISFVISTNQLEGLTREERIRRVKLAAEKALAQHSPESIAPYPGKIVYRGEQPLGVAVGPEGQIYRDDDHVLVATSNAYDLVYERTGINEIELGSPGKLWVAQPTNEQWLDAELDRVRSLVK